MLGSKLSCVSLGIVAGQWSRRHRDSGHSRQYIEDSGPREGSVSRQVLVEVWGGLGQWLKYRSQEKTNQTGQGWSDRTFHMWSLIFWIVFRFSSYHYLMSVQMKATLNRARTRARVGIPQNRFKPPSNGITDRSRRCFLCGSCLTSIQVCFTSSLLMIMTVYLITWWSRSS